MTRTFARRSQKIYSTPSSGTKFLFVMYCVLLKRSLASSETRVSQNGDLVLGGLFPIHNTARTTISSQSETRCGKLYTKGLIMANAMIFAVDLVNKQGMLPYNITMGYHIRDTCNNMHIAMESALTFVAERKTDNNGDKSSENRTHDIRIPMEIGKTEHVPSSEASLQDSLVAVIGAGGSELSIAVNNLLSAFAIPQIAYASTSTILSDKIRYKTFLRLTPPDNLQARALASLVSYFGWKYVSVIYSDDNYGRPLQEAFQNKAEQKGVCIANNIALPYRAPQELVEKKLIEIQQTPKSKVILVFASEFDTKNVLEAAKVVGIEDKVWIASDSWSDSLKLINDYKPLTNLLLGTSLHRRRIAGFEEALKRVIARNEGLFSNVANQAADNLDLTDSLAMAENVVNCVYATVQAINSFCRRSELLHSQGNATDVELKRECLRAIRPKRLLKYLFNTTLKGFRNNSISISEFGDPPGVYDFLNLHINLSAKGMGPRLATVGSYDSHFDKARLNHTALYWTLSGLDVPESKCSDPCLPGMLMVTADRKACCWDCEQCPFGHVSNTSMSTYCAQCPDEHISNEDNTACIYVPLIRIDYDNPWSIIIILICLISFVLTVITLALFVKNKSSPIVRSTCTELSFPLLTALAVAFLLPFIDIGKPTEGRCLLSAFAFSAIFNIILTLILATISRTVMVFEARATECFYNKILLSRRFLFGMVLVSFTVQCILCLLWFFLDPPHASQSEVSAPEYKRYAFCTEGGKWPLISIGYLALLSLICTGLAYRSRNLPENYNNAKFIAFAMFTFDLVGFTFLGAYHGTSNEGHRRLILRSCAIVTSGLCILLLIFGPKIYVILFRPELNNLRTFRKMTMEHMLRTSSVSASVSLKCVADFHGAVCVLESNFQEKAVQTAHYSRDVETQTDEIFSNPHQQNRKRGSFQNFLRRFSLGEQNGEANSKRKLMGETSRKSPKNQTREESEFFVVSPTNCDGCHVLEEPEYERDLTPIKRQSDSTPSLTSILHPVDEESNFEDNKTSAIPGDGSLELELQEWPKWTALKTTEIV